MEHALYGAQRAKEEATKRAALEERLAKKVAEREKIDRAKDWSEEEVRMLEKALDRFPAVRPFPRQQHLCSYRALSPPEGWGSETPYAWPEGQQADKHDAMH